MTEPSVFVNDFRGRVVLSFSKKVKGMTLDPDEARALGELLLERAERAGLEGRERQHLLVRE